MKINHESYFTHCMMVISFAAAAYAFINGNLKQRWFRCSVVGEYLFCVFSSLLKS